MQQLEILNTEVHRAVQMRIDSGVAHPHFVMITVGEFPAAASSCPIFFAKSPVNGEFYAGAMFGFQPGETLVDGAAQGRAAFQPLDLQRQGFFMVEDNLAIDPAHPRFAAGAAVALFEADGTPSNALRKVQRTMAQLSVGVDATRSFIQALLRLNLIEPVDISLQFDDGAALTLEGLYTVSRDALNDLDDSDVVALFRSGYLEAVICMSYSLNQVSVLARRRNERLTAPL
ncbi:SapC family protein [Sphingomonas sp. CJ20]